MRSGFSEIEREKIRPTIIKAFDQYPVAAEQYGSVPLYHLTHSSNVSGILEHGLRTNQHLFPEEHGQFLLRMLARYSSGHPNDRNFVNDRIIKSDTLYVSTEQPDMDGFLAYGIPERLSYLMRGLHALQDKQSLQPEERAYAAAAFTEHHNQLRKDTPTITAFRVSPFAPAVVESRLGGLTPEHLPDEETAIWIMQNVDQYPTNIPIIGVIESDYVEIYDRSPVLTSDAFNRTTQSATWADSIR